LKTQVRMDFPDLESFLEGAVVAPRSRHEYGGASFSLVRREGSKYLLIDPALALAEIGFDGDSLGSALICPLSNHNARRVREAFPFCAPRAVGLKKSFGAGDRLGIAGLAHIQAAREVGEESFALILAQQSMREMARTQRTPAQVLDAATWAAFEENFRAPWGADADHLKTADDVRLMAREGFTFFTIDPSEHVDAQAESYSADKLAEKFAALDGAGDVRAVYENQSFDIPATPDCAAFSIEFSPEVLQRAAVKYLRAARHTQRLAQVLGEEKDAFDLEMSVDETDAPTTVAEHFFIAHELKRSGVRLQSLALRFVGEFQKGIDYRGDLSEFAARLQEHVAIAKYLGPYKISIHSGSDKFSIFPIAARVCRGLLHEKTAGTWYLEALRVAARRDAPLFRAILDFARRRFPTDRATYHVVDSLGSLPDFGALGDDELEDVLNLDDGRQMLHVTFGSVLTEQESGKYLFRDRLYELWEREEELHTGIVAAHSARHMKALGMGEK
jgi:hypothetical protein